MENFLKFPLYNSKSVADILCEDTVCVRACVRASVRVCVVHIVVVVII